MPNELLILDVTCVLGTKKMINNAPPCPKTQTIRKIDRETGLWTD